MTWSSRLNLNAITALPAPGKLRNAERYHGIDGFARGKRVARSAGAAGTRRGAAVLQELIEQEVTEALGRLRHGRAESAKGYRHVTGHGP